MVIKSIDKLHNSHLISCRMVEGSSAESIIATYFVSLYIVVNTDMHFSENKIHTLCLSKNFLKCTKDLYNCQGSATAK